MKDKILRPIPDVSRCKCILPCDYSLQMLATVLNSKFKILQTQRAVPSGEAQLNIESDT